MTDTEATAQAQEEYRRVLEQSRGWSLGYLTATLVDSSTPPSHLLAARHEAARRLRARQRGEGDEVGRALTPVVHRLDQIAHECITGRVDSFVAVGESLDATLDDLRDRIRAMDPDGVDPQPVAPGSSPQREGEREPDWKAMLERYGSHHSDCYWLAGERDPSKGCNCGWQQRVHEHGLDVRLGIPPLNRDTEPPAERETRDDEWPNVPYERQVP